MGWKECVISIYGEKTGEEWIPRFEERIGKAKGSSDVKTRGEKLQNIILITYPDQFSGSEEKLRVFRRFAKKYLAEIFDVLHFLPFCPYSSDDGFSVIDYDVLAPGLGEWSDLQKLSREYTLMYDFVCNHVSAEHKWFQECLKGNPKYRKYFLEMNPQEDVSSVTRPRTTPLLTKYRTSDGERYFWTTFSDDQVDLNYANPQVLFEAVNVFLSYIEKGASWIRLDAVGFLWKELGTTCMHLPKTHEVVKLFRAIMDEVYPSGRIITETNVPHADNISYFGNGEDESHMVYQFPLPILVLYSFFKENASVMSKWADGLALPSNRTEFFNFLASHDGIGINPARNLLSEEEINALVSHLKEVSGALVSYKQNADGTESVYEINVSYFSAVKEKYDFETAKRRFVTAHAVLLALQGDPAIYIHSYLGTENDLDSVKKSGMNRSINRSKFQIDELEKELSDSESEREQIREALVELIRIRKGSDAFDTHSDQRILHLNESVFALVRSGKNEEVLCLNNFSGEKVIIENVFGRDLFTKEKVSGKAEISAYGFRWIHLNV